MGDNMEEKTGNLPPHPVDREEQYLDAIWRELRAIRRALAPAGAKAEDDLFGDEVELKEEGVPGAR